MAYLQETAGLIGNDSITIQCDVCGKKYGILFISAQRSIRKHGRHRCQSCSAKGTPKPQNLKAYWTTERKKAHGALMRNSEAYYKSRSRIDISGEKNGMFGKKHSEATRKKMSLARIGKLGPNATAWKGGRMSLVRRVKSVIHHRFNWYFRVYQRDQFKCTKCGGKRKLEAHHVISISRLIHDLCHNQAFGSEEEKIEWLAARDEIRDPDLRNGITLCRQCHKQEHHNWGSHNNP